jgi:hypothetical protein
MAKKSKQCKYGSSCSYVGCIFVHPPNPTNNPQTSSQEQPAIVDVPNSAAAEAGRLAAEGRKNGAIIDPPPAANQEQTSKVCRNHPHCNKNNCKFDHPSPPPLNPSQSNGFDMYAVDTAAFPNSENEFALDTKTNPKFDASKTLCRFPNCKKRVASSITPLQKTLPPRWLRRSQISHSYLQQQMSSMLSATSTLAILNGTRLGRKRLWI